MHVLIVMQPENDTKIQKRTNIYPLMEINHAKLYLSFQMERKPNCFEKLTCSLGEISEEMGYPPIGREIDQI